MVDLGTDFESFEYLGLQHVYLVMLVSRLLALMVFGFESGCPGLEN